MDRAKEIAEAEKEEKHQALLDRVVDALDRTRHFRKHQLAYQHILAEQAADRIRREERQRATRQRLIDDFVNGEAPPPQRVHRRGYIPGYQRTKKFDKPSWNVSQKLVVPKQSPVVKGRQYAAATLRHQREPSPAPEPEQLTPERQIVRELIQDPSSPYWKSNPMPRSLATSVQGYKIYSRVPSPPKFSNKSTNPGMKNRSNRATPFAVPTNVMRRSNRNQKVSDNLNRMSTPGPSRAVPSTYVQTLMMTPEYKTWKEEMDAEQNSRKIEKIRVRDTQAGVNLIPGIPQPPSKKKVRVKISHPDLDRVERFLLDPRVPPLALPKFKEYVTPSPSFGRDDYHAMDYMSPYSLSAMNGWNQWEHRPVTSVPLKDKVSSVTSTTREQRKVILESGRIMPQEFQDAMADIVKTLRDMSEDIRTAPEVPLVHDHDEMEENKAIRNQKPKSRNKKTILPVQPKTSDTYHYGFACYTKSGALVDSKTSLQSNVYPSPGHNNDFKMTVKHERPWTPPQEGDKPAPSSKPSRRRVPKE